MSLKLEIEQASLQVSTDAFSLTLGEIANLYKDGDIIINPNFQRLFRWDIERKSRLIESILVRIPLPSIFVFELGNSKWEVIDGLQRLSTILEFMGELKDPDTGIRITPRSLVGTQYLPSLKGAFWSDELRTARIDIDEHKKIAETDPVRDIASATFFFDGDTQRAVKRSKIGIQLLERKSDPKSKFDLFQRLNSGGLAANDQELRNCALVMVSETFFASLKELATSPEFAKLIPLGITSINKSNHLDNLCKIIAFSFRDYIIGTDIEEFVTNAMVDIASSSPEKQSEIFLAFNQGLNLLISACGYDALRPYKAGVFAGRIGRTSIEIILVGILKSLGHISALPNPEEFIRDRIISFWGSEQSRLYTAAGIAGTDRVQYTIPLGLKTFAK